MPTRVELNEVAINWNAPLTYALASFLDAYTGPAATSDAGITPADASGGAGGSAGGGGSTNGGSGGNASGGAGGSASGGANGSAHSGGNANGDSGGGANGGSGGASGGSGGTSESGSTGPGGSISGGSTGSGGGQTGSTKRTSPAAGCGCRLAGAAPKPRSQLIFPVLFVAGVFLRICRDLVRRDARLGSSPACHRFSRWTRLFGITSSRTPRRWPRSRWRWPQGRRRNPGRCSSSYRRCRDSRSG